jgi:hypothetical protein
MKKIVSRIMFTLFLIGMIGAVFKITPVAAGKIEDFKVYISPWFPTTNGEVNASVGFWFASLPYSVAFCNLTRVGNTFMAGINISWLFLDVYGPWVYNHTYCLGILPQGYYSFDATAYWILNGTRQEFAQAVKSFHVTQTSVPVGGYSIPVQGQTSAKPLTPYIILAAFLAISFTAIKRKIKRTK